MIQLKTSLKSMDSNSHRLHGTFNPEDTTPSAQFQRGNPSTCTRTYFDFPRTAPSGQSMSTQKGSHWITLYRKMKEESFLEWALFALPAFQGINPSTTPS